jgi:predicted O-methyltransferase YrrM
MSDTSVITDLVQVLLPGRRRLRKRQQQRESEKLRLQEQLIAEYQSLACLPARSGSAERLGEFDIQKFRRFITLPENDNAWNEARSTIAEFRLPEMAGGVNPGDQRLIYHLVQFLLPGNTLEVGTHIGSSTIHILMSLLKARAPQSGRLTSVDIKDVNCEKTQPWKQFGSQWSPRQMVSRLNQSANVEFVASPSIEFMKTDTKAYDLIFLDGDHSASAVYQELPLALDRLAKGGVILLHDYFPALQPLWPNGRCDNALMHADVIPGVYLALQRFLNEGNRIRVTPFGALPWPTKLGSNVTSLTLVSRDIA